jgi:hypothetical protein
MEVVHVDLAVDQVTVALDRVYQDNAATTDAIAPFVIYTSEKECPCILATEG